MHVRACAVLVEHETKVCLRGAPAANRGPCSVSADADGVLNKDMARARIAAATTFIFLISLPKLLLLISSRANWFYCRHFLTQLALDTSNTSLLRCCNGSS